MYFIELNEFGWNWLTASFICLTIITAWQYRSFTLQAIKIWEERNAENISISLVTSLFFITVASLWYGLTEERLVIAFTGGLALPGFFLTLGAWKFGGPTNLDKFVFGICFAGVLLFLLPIDAKSVFLGFAVGGTAPVADQIRKLYQAKTRGKLKGEFLLTLVVKNVWLNIYAFAVNEPVYMLLAPVYFGLTVWQLLLWWQYGNTGDEEGLA